jgi:hypothetical protein
MNVQMKVHILRTFIAHLLVGIAAEVAGVNGVYII